MRALLRQVGRKRGKESERKDPANIAARNRLLFRTPMPVDQLPTLVPVTVISNPLAGCTGSHSSVTLVVDLAFFDQTTGLRFLLPAFRSTTCTADLVPSQVGYIFPACGRDWLTGSGISERVC